MQRPLHLWLGFTMSVPAPVDRTESGIKNEAEVSISFTFNWIDEQIGLKSEKIQTLLRIRVDQRVLDISLNSL